MQSSEGYSSFSKTNSWFDAPGRSVDAVETGFGLPVFAAGVAAVGQRPQFAVAVDDQRIGLVLRSSISCTTLSCSESMTRILLLYDQQLTKTHLSYCAICSVEL